MIALWLAATIPVATPQIVVSGKRLEAAYAECVARRCTPLRDAQASIAWAEKLFRDGKYVPAKQVLANAVARERGFAKTDPKPVAALYEAFATVALQDGDKELYRRAVSGQVQTLRANLPPTDPAAIDAGLVLGDMWTKLGNIPAADAAYRAAERQARSRGQTIAALSAALRRVWLATLMGRQSEANRLLNEVVADPAAQDPAIRAIVPVVRLRLAAKGADDAETSRLIAALPKGDAKALPILVWSPPYKETASASAEDAALRFGRISPSAPRSSELDPIQWADVGFWIRPNGRTEDVEVLRGSPDRGWAKPILSQIVARRYAEQAASASGEGLYRVERFTLRGSYQVPIGSLIRRRSGAKRLEMLDLTEQSGIADPTS